MRITRRSRLSEVAVCVATTLAKHGIRGVLTGGACASLYTRGTYQSTDLDFVIQSVVTQSQLDAAMRKIGFERHANQYVHPETHFFIEFPAGPLAIAGDFRVRPVDYVVREHTVLTLSATDSCRDRLAAFYFWNDRQSLRTAVQIAGRRRVDMRRIREWSIEEGHQAGFEEFEHELNLARRRRKA